MKKLLPVVLSVFAFSLAPQAFGQALSNINIITGSGFEIVGTSTGSTFDITTKPGGGSVNISARSTGSGIFIASSTNYVGVGGVTNPQYALDVSTGVGSFSDVVSGSFSTAVHGPVLSSGDGYIQIGDINLSGFPVLIKSGSVSLDIGSSFVFSGGSATFDSAVTIGYPSVSTDAARKDYVDAAISSGASGIWKLSGSNIYASSTSYNVGIGTVSPSTKLDVNGTESTNRISQYAAGSTYTELATRSWGGNNAIFFGAYATSSYVSGDFLTAGNTIHKYASSSFGAADHRAKAIIGDHLGLGLYISGVSPGANQNVSWSQEFYVSPSNIYIPTNNVGIGESAPGSKLAVSGGATVGATYDTIAAPTNGLVVEGNVGIGTTTPSGSLHLWGSSGDKILYVEADADNDAEDDNPTVILRQDGNLVNGLFGIMGAATQYTNAIGNSTFVEAKDNGGAAALQFVTGGTTIGGTNGTARMTILAGGNIGIATSSPSAKLEIYEVTGSGVVPGIKIGGSYQAVNAGHAIDFYGTNQNIPMGRIASRADASGNLGALTFETAASSAVSSTERMRITNAGNIGIGTTTPATELHVISASGNAATFNQPITVGYPAVSTDAATKSYVDSVAGIAQSASWVQSGSNLYPSSTSWNVMVGTNVNSSDAKFLVKQSDSSQIVLGGTSFDGIKSLNINYSTAYDAGSIQAFEETVGAKKILLNYLGGEVGIGTTTPDYILDIYNNTNDANAGLRIKAGNTASNYSLSVGSASSEKFFVQAGGTSYFAGSLGINDTTPDYLLDVAGSAGFDDNLTLTGSAANIILGSNYLSGDGADEGVFVDSEGDVGVGTGAPGSYRLNVQGGSAQVLFETTSDAQIVLKSSDTWTGILFDDSGATNDYIWYNGANGTFAVGGGGASVAGKKIHIDGGMTVGVNYDAAAMASNGLTVEGSVGIGTTTAPATQLHLYDASSGPIITLSGATSVYRGLTVKNTAGAEQWFYGPNTSNNFVIRQSGTTDKITINSTGVGIGAAAQGPFHVALPAWSNHDTDSEHAILGDGSTNGGVRIGFNSSSRVGIINVLDPGAWWGYLVLQSGGGRVAIGTTTPATALQVIGTITATKINADEVDPPYTINGKKYATYMAGMTGLKEETSGVVKLKNGKAILDLADAEEGSDLWLFAQTINLSGKLYVSESGQIYQTTAAEVLEKIAVLLTPNFDGRVWYEKKDGKIVIMSSAKTGEVSYRLTGARFDAAKKDGNLRTGDDVEGLNLDKLLK